MTHDPSVLPDDNLPDYTSLGKIEAQAVGLMIKSLDQLPEQIYFAKPHADTLLYYADNPSAGVRTAIYYDGSTGLIRAYEVKYKFAAWQRMTYDSLEIIIAYNNTLENGSDDMLQEVYRQQLFETNFFVQQIVSQILVTDFVEQDITGLEAVVESYYNPARYLVFLRQSADLNPDNTGTLREDFEFRDGKTAFHSVTFNGDHTGTFVKQLRDGTTVSGSFNDVWDDNSGSYTESVDFPDGRYIDLINKYASVDFSPDDAEIMASLARAVHFASGRVDSSHIDIYIQWNEGVKQTELDITKPNGAHGSFIIEETDDMALLTGQWTTWNDYYIYGTAEYYSEGSAHVHYEVYAPPFTQGDTPIIVADYYLSPDGSGTGTIVYNGETYQINFNSLVEAELSRGGQRKTIQLYR
jgi:hypothetical protein